MPWRDIPIEQMHLCPGCSSPLLAMKHAANLPGGWLILSAFCPNCRQEWNGPASMDQVCALAESTEQGMAEILVEVHRLHQDSSG